MVAGARASGRAVAFDTVTEAERRWQRDEAYILRRMLAEEARGDSPYPCSTDVTSETPVRWAVAAYSYPDGSTDGSITPVPEPRSSVDRVTRLERALSGASASAAVFFGIDAVDSEMCAPFADAKRLLNDTRAVQRARVAVRRAVRYGDYRCLLTFTNGAPQGWQTRKEALDCVAQFLDWHGKRFLHGSGAVLVAERGGANGRWHVHAACRRKGRWNYGKMVQRWSRYMCRQKYFSPVGTHRFHVGEESGSHKGGFSSARVCARYLVKYLVKSLAADGSCKGERRYRLYHVTVPVPVRFTVPGWQIARELLTLPDVDCHAAFSPALGFSQFRCYVFDSDWVTVPEWLAGATVDDSFESVDSRLERLVFGGHMSCRWPRKVAGHSRGLIM